MKPGEYHLGAIIAVGNDQGEILCTLRSPEKKFCPGIWENTGGGALAGETSRAAAQRELQEETGIFAELEEFYFSLPGTVHRAGRNRTFLMMCTACAEILT